MIPCNVEVVVVDRVEDGVVVLELEHESVVLDVGVAVVAASGLREGSEWRLCLVPPVASAAAGAVIVPLTLHTPLRAIPR